MFDLLNATGIKKASVLSKLSKLYIKFFHLFFFQIFHLHFSQIVFYVGCIILS